MITEAKWFLCVFCPCNANFHLQLSVRRSFYLFYVRLHQMALVIFQCSHPPRRNACKCNAKQLYQWDEQNHRNYIKHTIFLMCGHSYFAEHKETLSGFHSLKLAVLTQTRWVEISSSLISRSTFEENQGKSHFSVQSEQSLIAQQKWLGNTHSYWNLFGWSYSPWSKNPNKHAYDLRNTSVPSILQLWLTGVNDHSVTLWYVCLISLLYK